MLRNITLFLLGLGMLFSSAAFAAKKPLVAVMDFDNNTQYGGWRIGSGASDMLATALVKKKVFRVIERDKLSAILKEQDLGASGRIDSSTAAKIGKILGVSYIVTGAVTEYGQSKSNLDGGGVSLDRKTYEASVDIRILDAVTGEIVFADNASGSKSSNSISAFGFGGGESYDEKKASAAMRKAINKLVKQIKSQDLVALTKKANKPKGPALIADVDGTAITLNQGSAAGFEAGQVLAVKRKGKVIKDPSTGEVLKIKYKTVGKIKITEVEGSYSEAVIVEGSGFTVGDQVEK